MSLVAAAKWIPCERTSLSASTLERRTDLHISSGPGIHFSLGLHFQRSTGHVLLQASSPAGRDLRLAVAPDQTTLAQAAASVGSKICLVEGG